MKYSRKRVVFGVVASLVFAVIGFIFADHFLEFVLSQFDDLDVRFQITELSWQMTFGYSFAFVFASFPILMLISNYFLREEKSWKTWFVIPITLLCGLGFMFLSIYSLRADILNMPQISPEIQNAISISSIDSEQYLGMGFFFGALMSTVLFYFTSEKRKI